MIQQYVKGGTEEISLVDLLAEAEEKNFTTITLSQLIPNEEYGYLDEKRRVFFRDEFPNLAEALEGKTWELWRSSYFTGHMHLNYGGESINSCGNCDGARCDTCEQVFKAELREVT